MLIYMLICVIGLLVFGGLRGLLVIAVNAAVLVYYRHMAYRQFGGITGDLAGWFVSVTETLFLCWLALAPLFGL